MKKNLLYLGLLNLGLTASLCGYSQPVITGPGCVVPGTTYQYRFANKWKDSATMQVCLGGAVITGLNDSCTGNGNPFASLLVTWNTGITTGSVNLISTDGNSSLAVTVTQPLQAGVIPIASLSQSIDFNGKPAIIQCGPDKGGACKPVYTHQWQQSLDRVHWTDIPGAGADDLLSIPALMLTRFFRRKTVETVSGTIAFSDAAVVFVGPPPAGYTISITDSNWQ
jgi:hypothetical protein